LQKARAHLTTGYDGEENFALRSFSVIPEEDTPEVLKAYADSYGVNHEQWHLITGDKAEIYNLARKSYFTLKKAEVGQGDGGSSDFIHTNNFVLVDGKKRIRGYYDGTSAEDIDRLIEDVENLLNEKKKFNQ
jgi:protein SCO1/2